MTRAATDPESPKPQRFQDGNDDDDENTPPVPLDGGWGWVVVAASLLCNIIVDGVCFSFGVLYLELLEAFGESKGKTAWVGSLVPGMYLGMGPIVSALANHFGCKAVTVAGSLIAAVSFFISTFSPNINVLIITYGVMGGMGFGLMYLPSIVIVGYYFDKKRAMATGIAVCGSGIGTFIFGPFTRILLDEYGWKGTNWIISAIILHGVACGLLFRALEDNRPIVKKEEVIEQSTIMKKIIADKKRQRTISTGSMDGSLLTKDNRLIKDPEEVKRILEKYNNEWRANLPDRPGAIQRQISATSSAGVTPLMQRQTSVTTTSNNGGMHKVPSMPETATMGGGMSSDPTAPTVENGHLSVSTSNIGGSSGMAVGASVNGPGSVSAVNKKLQQLKLSAQRPQRRNSTSSQSVHYFSSDGNLLTASQISLRNRKQFKPLYRQDIFYSGSVTSLQEFKSTSDMSAYVRSYTHIPPEPEDPTSCQAKCLPLVSVLKEMLDFSLLKSPTFVILCFASILAMTGFFTPFVYVTSHAIQVGVSTKAAVYLLSILGLCNTIGRIISGLLSDQPWADCLLIHNLALITAGLATMCVPFLTNFPLLAIYCVIFGLCIAAFIALRSIVLIDILGLRKLNNSLGILLLFQGISCIVGSPMAGAIFDATGSYTVSFMVSGGLIAVAGIICLPVRRISKWENSRNPDPDYNVVSTMDIPLDLPVPDSRKVSSEYAGNIYIPGSRRVSNSSQMYIPESRKVSSEYASQLPVPDSRKVSSECVSNISAL